LAEENSRHDTIVILDFGSQYTQLIARRIRELKVYCEILPYHTAVEALARRAPKGVILSGGPASVYDDGAPILPEDFFRNIDSPVLGICYGLQLMARHFGGAVLPAEHRGYGFARLSVVKPDSLLFDSLPGEMDVWMSHGDHVTGLPEGFVETARTDKVLSGFEDAGRRLYGVQFHPEVAHTPFGSDLIRNFLFGVCRVAPDWSPPSIITEQVREIRARVGGGKVVCGLSGGVDSTVAAAIVHEALGERQVCVFINNGLLRQGEFERTCALYRQQMRLNVVPVDASRPSKG
jgi:GMP synthase (glutamine-hydrolysing)